MLLGSSEDETHLPNSQGHELATLNHGRAGEMSHLPPLGVCPLALNHSHWVICWTEAGQTLFTYANRTRARGTMCNYSASPAVESAVSNCMSLQQDRPVGLSLAM